MANKKRKDGYTVLTNGKLIKDDQVPDWYKNYSQKQGDYIKKTYKTFLLKLNKEDDEDIIKLLDEQTNKVDYIRKLLRKELKKKRG